MPDIDVTLKLKDELTAGMKKANAAMDDLDSTAESLIGQFIDGAPELAGFRDELVKMAKDMNAGNVSMEEATKRMEEIKKQVGSAEKVNKGFNKGLGNMVKGFVGIGTAIAAGRALLSFAKDSFAAAKAAGTLPPVFKKAETAGDRLKLAVGTQLGNELKGTAKVFTDLTNRMAETFEISTRLNKLVEEGVITQKEAKEIARDRTNRRISQAEELKIVIDLERQLNQETITGADFLAQRISEEERLATIRSAAAAEAGITAGTGAAIAAQIPGLLRAPVEIVPFFEGLDPGILSAIQAEIDKGEFFLAGGEGIAEDLERAQRALDAGNITMAQFLETTRALEQQAVAVQVVMGQITLRDAAIARQKEYGGTLAENEAAVLAVIDALKQLDGTKVRAFVDIRVGGQGFLGSGPQPNVGGQSGVSGIVPPGFSNDSFMIGANTGEEFSVRTPAQQGGNNAALEAEMAGMRRDFKNGLLDIAQMMAERG